MRHAGPIRVTQQLIAHVQRRFKHGDSAKAAPRLGFQQSFNVPNWAEPAQTQPSGICAEHGLKLPRHEQASAQEVCPGIISAVFEQTCSFWIKRLGENTSQEPPSKVA